VGTHGEPVKGVRISLGGVDNYILVTDASQGYESTSNPWIKFSFNYQDQDYGSGHSSVYAGWVPGEEKTGRYFLRSAFPCSPEPKGVPKRIPLRAWNGMGPYKFDHEVCEGMGKESCTAAFMCTQKDKSKINQLFPLFRH
jgi:hypothetical protein